MSRDGEVPAPGAATTRWPRPRPRCGGGAILAVKGVGGYHLACRADDETAVAALRARKHREDKPFALMVAGVADAERLVALGDAEAGPARLARAADRARPAPARTAPVVRGRCGGARCARSSA